MLVFMTMSCTVNDGDIGPLYGSWVMESMEVDGKPYEGWRQEPWTGTYWEFQNNILEIKRTSVKADTYFKACTWTLDDDGRGMQLDWTHSDNANPSGTGPYAPPGWIMMPAGRVTLKVTWHGERRMTLATTDTSGRRLTYNLKQTW